MGMFSWLDCKDNSQIKTGDTVYMLIPECFGGGRVKEYSYQCDGYFGGLDVFVVIAEWNTEHNPEVKDEMWDEYWEELRATGVDLAGDDENNAALQYPIKITHDPNAIYEEYGASKYDPLQGCN